MSWFSRIVYGSVWATLIVSVTEPGQCSAQPQLQEQEENFAVFDKKCNGLSRTPPLSSSWSFQSQNAHSAFIQVFPNPLTPTVQSFGPRCSSTTTDTQVLLSHLLQHGMLHTCHKNINNTQPRVMVTYTNTKTLVFFLENQEMKWAFLNQVWYTYATLIYEFWILISSSDYFVLTLQLLLTKSNNGHSCTGVIILHKRKQLNPK